MPIPADPETMSALEELGEGAKQVLKWIIDPQLQEQLFPLRIVFVLFGLGFLVIIVYMTIRTSYMDWWFMGFLKDFLFPKVFERQIFVRKWKKVKKGMKKDFEDQWKLSVIEGANLIDRVLKEAGYGGDNLGERLTQIDKEEIINLSDLIKAEVICRDVVRDPDYHLTKDKAQEIITVFEHSLKDLNVL